MVLDNQLGIIGAGRLGQAIGKSIKRIWGVELPVWSRRFGMAELLGSGYPGLRGVSLGQIAAKKTLFSAVPNSALTALVRANTGLFRSCSGLVLLAGADAPSCALVSLLSNATLVRIIPILLPGKAEIAFFALEPPGKSEVWCSGREFLASLGTVSTVQDSAVFEELMILTSPFATVVRAALSSAIAEFLSGRQVSEEWHGLAETVAAISLSGQDFPIGKLGGGVEDVATPGGITEAGLSQSRQLVRGFLAVFKAMRVRADSLGAEGIE